MLKVSFGTKNLNEKNYWKPLSSCFTNKLHLATPPHHWTQWQVLLLLGWQCWAWWVWASSSFPSGFCAGPVPHPWLAYGTPASNKIHNPTAKSVFLNLLPSGSLTITEIMYWQGQDSGHCLPSVFFFLLCYVIPLKKVIFSSSSYSFWFWFTVYFYGTCVKT